MHSSWCARRRRLHAAETSRLHTAETCSRAGKRVGCAPRAHAEFARRVACGGVRRVRAVCTRRPAGVFRGDGALPRPWCLTARSSQAAWGREASPSPPSSHGESHPELEPQPGRWKVKVRRAVRFSCFSEKKQKGSEAHRRVAPRRFKSQARARVLGSRLLRETLLPKPKHTHKGKATTKTGKASRTIGSFLRSRVNKSSASP